ncbi:pyrimidine 5'-nucleotidase [Blastochloris viridis]|uniref:Phosphatase YqaB n=1 Tax=Blastochloris viridis TaxID=1079 RepID=A0A0H5BBC7_BLAVI|nr:pyrimidine 5'-nucleotidase [Blastochloris viridis]ALK08335.1 Fructose-1-phosphate phosphatase YqaB [Blastochloris viridis]BAR98394.1 pyridoxal-5'-phosphate phosphatase [Blastochloris viridis]CUU44257.1 Phosphatase YqaB [Blastochloris viridis]
MLTIPAPARAARGFADVDAWVFDLDNTLYPAHLDLWSQIDERMTDYITGFLGVGRDEAFRLQKDYYRRFGTSMRGLMINHGLDPAEFLHFVHDIDHSPIEPAPLLGAALAALPGQKLILTNGSVAHAEAVTGRLGLSHHFDGVFDIFAADFVPKPNPETYLRFLDRHGVDPTRAAMFEDLARNLTVPHELGMTTVLVTPDAAREVEREAWELEGRADPHIDHVTSDLAGFLHGIAAALTRR